MIVSVIVKVTFLTDAPSGEGGGEALHQRGECVCVHPFQRRLLWGESSERVRNHWDQQGAPPATAPQGTPAFLAFLFALSETTEVEQ